MKLETTRFIHAPREKVWDSLVDVEVLEQCIPGCQSMEQTGENEYALTMKSKVGPVSATFTGELSLRDVVPGESYTLYFEGKGGAAGFSKGSAAVRLEEAEGGTNLHYTVDAKIGGKIAQLGQRLVDGAARKMAEDFFGQFEQIVAPGEDEESNESGRESAPSRAAGSAGEVNDAGTSARTWLWIAGGVVVIAIVWLAG